eukprot:scaffold1439_cov404-Prasinococcus_capsulatus_cf.AAC.43
MGAGMLCSLGPYLVPPLTLQFAQPLQAYLVAVWQQQFYVVALSGLSTLSWLADVGGARTN